MQSLKTKQIDTVMKNQFDKWSTSTLIAMCLKLLGDRHKPNLNQNLVYGRNITLFWNCAIFYVHFVKYSTIKFTTKRIVQAIREECLNAILSHEVSSQCPKQKNLSVKSVKYSTKYVVEGNRRF